MNYLLLIHYDENTWTSLSQTERERMVEEHQHMRQQLAAKSQFLAGARLHPTTSATSVRMRDGKRLVTDGPFAETSEQLGGYLLVEARDLDEAIDIAGRIPAARMGTVEVRPVDYVVTPDTADRTFIPR
jgi:hypothetical protein